MWNDRHVNRRFLRALNLFLNNPFIWFYALSWIIIRYTRNQGTIIPYLNNWLTDFVFVPLIAHVAYVVGYFLIQLPADYKIPLGQLLVMAGLTTVIFEVLCPIYTTYNTADPIDALCYFLGAIWYYAIHQPYMLFRNQKLSLDSI
ncbi:hypothetical protein SAMN05421877_102359 [Sphingobacterium lactis]|uniref:VanZ like family protein n=1 Tax=Sphingobacterium lactis TaxID=797291 RepID=A0A1H5UNQ3_9SPHI|nr:hypothetical protein SAMN05421877_102359 [Sphingobacterium lactis]